MDPSAPLSETLSVAAERYRRMAGHGLPLVPAKANAVATALEHVYQNMATIARDAEAERERVRRLAHGFLALAEYCRSQAILAGDTGALAFLDALIATVGDVPSDVEPTAPPVS